MRDNYVAVRLDDEDMQALKRLQRVYGRNRSEILRRLLHYAAQEMPVLTDAIGPGQGPTKRHLKHLA